MNSITFGGDNHGLQNGINHGSITVNCFSVGRTSTDTSEMLDWLSSSNVEAKQADMFGQRQRDTGQWFLETSEFKRWSNRDYYSSEDQRTLYCHGTQGAGKTVISAIVIDELRRRSNGDTTVPVAFFYCNFREPMTFHKVLASLLRQLLGESASELKELYEKRRNAPPTMDELSNILGTIVSQLSNVFIIIDALDEGLNFEGFDEFFETISSIQSTHDLRLLVTSRENPEIARRFHRSPCLRIRAHEADIANFVKQGLKELRALRGRPRVILKIVATITEAAQGMFLLAKLQLQSLLSHFGTIRASEDMILAKLTKIPRSLEEAFEETMNRIDSQPLYDAEVAKQALAWILYATRPLSPREVQHALAVGFNEYSKAEKNLIPTKDIISVCAGLVTVDERSDIIRLGHYTMQEYFQEKRTRFFPHADGQLAAACLSYLSITSNDDYFDSVNQQLDHVLEHALYKYSARNWGHHSREAYERVQEQVQCFVQSKWPLACSLQVLFDGRYSWTNTRKSLSEVSPLHPASYFGLDECVFYLLEAGVSCDRRDGHGQTALHWAARNGQSNTAELLLKNGLQANVRDSEGRSAIHYAAANGYPDSITVLVNYAADLEAVDLDGQTPLLTALQNKNFQSAQRLIDLGASVFAMDYMHRTALHFSTLGGSRGSQVTALLLSKGVSPEKCDVENMTPLHYAIRNGFEKTAELLIQRGACVNASIERIGWIRTKAGDRWVYQRPSKDAQYPRTKSCRGLTPLHWAALIGHHKMVRFLLARGANPNTRCQGGETALHLAIRGDISPDYGDAWNSMAYRIEVLSEFVEDPGSEEANDVRYDIMEVRSTVLDSLLSHPNIDVNMRDDQMQAPLHLVAYGRYGAMESFLRLMSKIPNVSIRNKKGQTPLHLASSAGDVEIVRKLLSAGASVTTMDDEEHHPLQCALSSETCSVRIIKLLLERYDMIQANPCLQADKEGRNLLHHHVQSGECSEEVIHILLERGLDINMIDANGDTPLSLYLRTDHLIKNASICRYLLAHGASSLWKDSLGRNLAHIVMISCCLGPIDEILLALRDFAVDLKAKDSEGRNIVHHGAMNGLVSQELLDILRESGSLPLLDPDKYGQSPMSYATQAEKRQSLSSFRRSRFISSVDILIEDA